MIQTTTNDFVAFINTRIKNTIPKEYRDSKHITWHKNMNISQFLPL